MLKTITRLLVGGISIIVLSSPLILFGLWMYHEPWLLMFFAIIVVPVGIVFLFDLAVAGLTWAMNSNEK